MESGGLTSTASSAEGRVGGEVRHVLETVEVPGGEEQRGLYAKMLVTEVRASGTRERILQTFVRPEDLIGYLRQLSEGNTPHSISFSPLGVGKPKVTPEKGKFGDAQSLTRLTLDHMNLRRLHPSIGRLARLQSLSLQHNRLTDLPLTIRLLRRLQHLNITGNPFSALPGAVFHLHALTELVGCHSCPLQTKKTGGGV